MPEASRLGRITRLRHRFRHPEAGASVASEPRRMRPGLGRRPPTSGLPKVGSKVRKSAEADLRWLGALRRAPQGDGSDDVARDTAALTRRMIGAAAALVAAALSALPIQAQTVADFYRGKTLRMLIGYGPGGGYDIYGRLVAEFLPRHVPGTPTIVTQNMPGAGS